MPLRINNAAISNAELLYRLDHCANTTVGSEKYQFYCQTVSNINGACTSIPSQYLTNGLDCPVMATDAWLDKVYAQTGLSCSINCYYYGYGIPTINIPTINIPTINIPTIAVPTIDYTTKAYTTTTPAAVVPIPTYDPIPIAPIVNNSSSVSSASSNTLTHSASGTTGAPVPGVTLGTSNQISSAKNLSPNILLLVVLLFSVMTLFRRLL